MNVFHCAPRALSALTVATMAAVATLGTSAAAAADAAVAAAERWDLRDLYPNAAAWDAAFDAASQRAAALAALRDGFAADAASMRDALLQISDTRRAIGRLSVYAGLQADENLREPRAQERRQRAQALWSRVEEATAWVTPAIQALGADRARAWVASDAVLRARFDRTVEDALRHVPHTLSPESEALLAAAGLVLAQPDNVYSQLAEAEFPWATVTLADGRSVELTTHQYEVERRSLVREDRRRVFDAFFGAFKRFEGTFGANLNAAVVGNVFAARARRFPTVLDAELFDDAMPPAVLRTLVAQAHAGLPVLHRYLRLRARVLGVDGPLAYYDNYPPLAPPPPGERFDVARSKALTETALAPVGDDYLALLRRGFAATWTDTHPRPGKAQGAYVSGWAYDVHPYMLLNHSDDYESLSTFAHEWGHAVHTLLASAKQPFEKAGYSTFVAESAAIANELLLSDHLVAGAKTPDERRYYLSAALESIRTTFFRQVMFAEFQLAMHDEVEQGRPLSGAKLTQMYCDVARRYYGHDAGVMTIDPAYCTEWAYISHFYAGYYVWQYATSFVGAAELTNAIAVEGAPARQRFVDLLAAGGADDAYRLYVAAGVDLATAAPYQALFARMNRLLDDYERVAAQR